MLTDDEKATRARVAAVARRAVLGLVVHGLRQPALRCLWRRGKIRPGILQVVRHMVRTGQGAEAIVAQVVQNYGGVFDPEAMT